MPSETWAGVFGMTRTTGVPSGSPASSWAVVTPAHSDTTSVPARRRGAISGSRSATSWGLTTSTTVSAPSTASAGDSTQRTP